MTNRMNIIGNDAGAGARQTIHEAISSAIPNADVEVLGGNGHFSIKVISTVFEGMSTLNRQRLVHKALAELINGADAPIHAIDKLETLTA